MKLRPLSILLLLIIGCQSNSKKESSETIKAPVAKKFPVNHVIHDDTRLDNYFWMRLTDEQKSAENPDEQTQDVVNYLNEENNYLNEVMQHTDAFQDRLFNEMVGRIKKDDQSVPVNDNGYSYYTRFEEGGEYALYCRKKLEDNASEEVILNGPEMAKGFSYFGIGSRDVSPDNKLMAFGIDTISRRQYTIYFKNLETGELLSDKLSNTGGSATWANDNKTVFYSTKDPQTLRQNKVYKHVLGTDQTDDVMVYEEKDDTYRTGVFKTNSKAFIFIGSFQTLSSEYRFLDANKPDGNWQVLQPRESDLLYYADHFGDDFYIRTNDHATNFKLVKTPIKSPTKDNWEDVIPHRETVLLENFDLFKNHLVINERLNGLRTIRIMPWEGEDFYMEFKDPAYTAFPTSNLDFDTNILRYGYSSLTTPFSTYEYNMDTKEQVLLKQEAVLGGFNANDYTSERLESTATDGTKIPISMVYKKGIAIGSDTPLLLYGYGSYGNSSDPSFRSDRLSLLDRGFVYAIAHVRGGQEMGRQWYENGKLLNKKNTFTDFIDAGKYLVDKGYSSPEHLYAMGGSAGGLLMGAVVNMEPSLWNGVIAAVPFVDVVTTMLDESIPLTTFEYDEWGNPNDKVYYDYIKSYSPYDNVTAQDYPNMLVTTGYWDSQVQYWEPAKWVAKLRDLKTDDNLLIMDCNMETGHGGASGRFERYKRTALYYAFLFHLEGIED
ncbi:oligopeptidase B [Hanstruepera neustonica]|uniref:Proline-specific endopeptidase n=1 Tax=Hanstruepera neustonica TaxID=1445657 RepID=A0A2K1DYK8_9FLAO|nr:S9 family peptidase [Hanstruepera neustonica]PNQ73103.1 oligopeptidase B [Hanstruepera neustonica]